MSLPLFFCDPGTDLAGLAAGGVRTTIVLMEEDARHMVTMNVKAGDHVRLSDGHDKAVEAEVVSPPLKRSSACEVRIAGRVGLPYRPDLTLVQGVLESERMDLLVRQAVELGVRRIIPAVTERCIVSFDAEERESRACRWRSVAISAAKQSGQPVVPAIETPVDLPKAIEEAASADVVIVPWEECRAGSVADALRGADRDTKAFLFVGPEGGFASHEVNSMLDAGRRSFAVSLGDLILRAETAGIIASALAIYELGGLGNGGTGGPRWGTVDA